MFAKLSLAGWGWVLGAILMSVPAILLRTGLLPLPLPLATAAYGVAILGAAFLITWAAEAAEHEMAGALALVVLSLVAVLPEYAVDMSFAWTAGHHPEYAAYAAANMTGANRLLIGFGWAAIVLVFWLKTRRPQVEVAKRHTLELGLLAVATVYAFIIVLKHSLSPVDGLVLIALFGVYLWLAAHGPSEEVELIGPAARIGRLPRGRRRLVLLALFLYSAAVILLAAEAFAGGLVETGTRLGIDRFLLVQWVAPLASEAPELIAAMLLCLRGRASGGVGVLLSSTVNQWTLLIGGLPLAYSLARGVPAALPLDPRQTEELLLTAAQALFGVAILVSLSLSLAEAGVLLGLFAVALVVQNPLVRYLLVVVYVLASLIVFWRQRHDVLAALRWWRSRWQLINPGRAGGAPKRAPHHGDSR